MKDFLRYVQCMRCSQEIPGFLHYCPRCANSENRHTPTQKEKPTMDETKPEVDWESLAKRLLHAYDRLMEASEAGVREDWPLYCEARRAVGDPLEVEDINFYDVDYDPTDEEVEAWKVFDGIQPEDPVTTGDGWTPVSLSDLPEEAQKKISDFFEQNFPGAQIVDATTSDDERSVAMRKKILDHIQSEEKDNA